MSDLSYLVDRAVEFFLQGPTNPGALGALPIDDAAAVIESDAYGGPYPDEYAMTSGGLLSVIGGVISNADPIEWEYLQAATITGVGWVKADANNTVTAPYFTTDLATPEVVALGSTLQLPAEALSIGLAYGAGAYFSNAVRDDFLGTMCGTASAFGEGRWLALLDDLGVEQANDRLRIDYYVDAFLVPHPPRFTIPPAAGISENLYSLVFSEDGFGSDILVAGNYQHLAIFDAATAGSELIRFDLDRVYTSVDQGLITFDASAIQFTGVVL